MINSWIRDVIDFHYKFCPERVGSTPKIPADRVGLLLALIDEEFNELEQAMEAGDLADTADAMADLIYVVLGAATTCGIDLAPVWDAVQAANMAKVGGSKRADGKLCKPPGFKPPDIAGVLEGQCSLEAIYPARGEEGP